MSNLDPRFVLVTRKTRLDEQILHYNTLEQARFYLTRMGVDFDDYQIEHSTYYKALEETLTALTAFGRVQQVDRKYLPNFMFGDDDIVFTLGQDGLAANTLKYLGQQPLVGLNPDPGRWEGVLLPFNPGELQKVLREIICGKRPAREVSMATVTLNDGQELHAVNDFFIGQRTHASARYTISYRGKYEYQSSSGIIVSTGMGATGWLSSVVTGSALLNKGSSHIPVEKMQWDSPYLWFVLREPYPYGDAGATMTYGKIDQRHPLNIESGMPVNGVIFSDGIENDYLEFNSGMKASISLATRKGRMLN
ncbi:MAG: sugar kinase [Calditrichota bacterium]